jgi:putative aldouronate transport system substrate-binding protein
MYWNFGIEGESYEIVDGKPQFTEKVTKDERGMTQALRDWCGASAMPVGLQMEAFVRAKNNPACGDSVDEWVKNQDAAKYYVPGLPLTADEQTANKDITTALNTYVQEQTVKFIMGDRSLDEFDAFVAELEKIGLNDSLKISNDAYARFLSAK